jgi:hypothetical protein
MESRREERSDVVVSRILWMETIGGGSRRQEVEPHLLIKQGLFLIIINIIILNTKGRTMDSTYRWPKPHGCTLGARSMHGRNLMQIQA